MKFAWIQNDQIRDICQGGDPATHYHQDVAVLYNVQVPDEAVNGDIWKDGQLSKPQTESAQTPEVMIIEPPPFGQQE